MTRVLSNVSLKDFRAFLVYVGCVKISTRGGHEKLKMEGILRSIIFQTHEDPIPRYVVVYSNLRLLELSREDFEIWYKLDRLNEK